MTKVAEPGALFVGRARELAKLRAGLEAALAGRGRFFLIAGEPGIGKTSLAEVVALEATGRGARLARGRCWEGDGAPSLWPWVQVLRSFVRDSPAADRLAEDLGRGAPYVAQVVTEIRDRRPDIALVPAPDGEQARFQLFDSVTIYLRNLAVAAPLVILIDDLQWADAVSLRLLRFAAREMNDAPILILATYRDVEVAHGHALADVLASLRLERGVTRLLLRGLSESEVGEMSRAVHGGELPDPLVRTLHAETGGNPFFVEETLRHLIEEGTLERLTGDVPGAVQRELLFPESVRHVIGRRLARLSEPCRRILAAASVIGQEFGLEVARRVTGVERAGLIEALEEALGARVVVEEDRASRRYAFSHALIRETLYGALGGAERARLHREIAAALEDVHARRLEPHLSEIAHHLLEALPAGDVERAVDFAERAAAGASRLLAYEEAARFYERAAEALALVDAAEERRRCELLLRLGEMWIYAGAAERPQSAFFEAARIARALSAPHLLARAALAAAGSFADTDAVPSAGVPELLEEALLVVPPEERSTRAWLMAQLARTLVWTTDDERPFELARAAIELSAGSADPLARIEVLAASGRVLIGPDTLEECRAHAEEVVRLSTERGDVRGEREGRAILVTILLAVGDRRALEREIAAHARLAAKTKRAQARWQAALYDTLLALIEGRFSEVEALARRALDLGEVSKNSQLAFKAHLEDLRWQQDRLEEAMEFARELSHSATDVMSHSLMADVAADVSRAEAREHMERLATAPLRRDLEWLIAMSNLCVIAARLGDLARAEEAYERLLPYAARCLAAGPVRFRGSVSRPLGMAASCLGRYDAAERHFEDALAANRQMKSPPWVAWTQYEYARMFLAREAGGDRERSVALAADALATARMLGMKLLERKLGELPAPIAKATIAASTGPAAPTNAAFRKEGDVWSISWEGRNVRLRDSKGLGYIAALLANPGRELHATELAAGRESPLASGHAGAILDGRAKGEYQARLKSLREELEQARGLNDAGHAARLTEEIEILTAELSSAFGLGGRARRAGDVAERARTAVKGCLKDSIARIRRENESLARHLENSIKTGIFCGYFPEKDVSWDL